MMEALSQKEAERLMAAERQGMLRYACYRLGNLDDAEYVVQDAFVGLPRPYEARLDAEVRDPRRLSWLALRRYRHRRAVLRRNRRALTRKPNESLTELS